MEAQRLRLTSTESQAVSGTIRLLREYGNAAWADWMNAELSRGYSAIPYIVVVGEVKRGKSSLVNALVGQQVSPSGADVVTAGFVRVVPPSDALAAGQVSLHFPDGNVRVVPLAEVTNWIAVVGSGDHVAAEVLPTSVAIAATSRWLPGVSIVDTPGVGGMNSAHGELARIAAQQASALLFVTDGGQILTAPELAFLKEVSRSVESVIFAVAKIDRHPAEWREVVAENRALLAQHAPRFASADMFPVSAALAREAEGQADTELRELLEQASGVPALAEGLAARVSDSRALHLANVLRGGSTGLDQARAALAVRKESLGAGPEARSEIEAEKARLQQLLDQQARWTLDLEVDLGRLRQDTVSEITGRIKTLKAERSAELGRERKGLSAAVAQQRAAELESALMVLSAEVADFYYARRAEIWTNLFADELAPEVLGSAPEHLRDLKVEVFLKSGTSPGVIDPSLLGGVMMGLGVGWRFGSWAGPVGAAVIGLGAATGMVLLNIGFKGIRAGRQELIAMLADAAAAAQSDLVGAVEADLRVMKRDLVLTFRDHLNGRIDELKKTIAALNAASRQSAAQTAKQVTNIDRQITAITAQENQIVEVIGALGSPAGTNTSPESSNGS